MTLPLPFLPCPLCHGEGQIDMELYPSGGQVIAPAPCPQCEGEGEIEMSPFDPHLVTAKEIPA